MQARTVYIGQTLGTPASVLLPESGGAVNVLGAFVSEGISLERHLLTVVRPWLLAKGNLSQDRVLGVHEETDSWDLIQILERTIGRRWEPCQSSWEGRREALLDLLGRFVPWSYPGEPALKIDGVEARLLVEALSGRWSYEKDRRDRRDVWWFIADAFSLAISRIEPISKPEPAKPIKVSAMMDVRRGIMTGRYR